MSDGVAPDTRASPAASSPGFSSPVMTRQELRKAAVSKLMDPAALAAIALWMAINHARAQPFDPYPYILLNLILSCLAALQALKTRES